MNKIFTLVPKIGYGPINICNRPKSPDCVGRLNKSIKQSIILILISFSN